LEPWLSYTDENEKVDYNKKDWDKELGLNIISAGSIFWTATDSAKTATIEYRKNSGEWTEITSTTEGTEIPVNAGDFLEFRGDNGWISSARTSYYPSSNVYYINSFSGSTAPFVAIGNVMSLLNSTGFSEMSALTLKYCLAGLFNYSSIVDAKNLVLPAKTITEGVYREMFKGCSGLTVPIKELPASTGHSASYYSMFSDCINLATAPAIRAVSLSTSACSLMFAGCTSLTDAPELPAISVGQETYYRMFSGCTSLTGIPETFPVTGYIGTRGCCQMFYGCTSLTDTMARLPRPSGDFSFAMMFDNCTSLTGVSPDLLTAYNSYGCYQGMFKDCTSLTDVPVNLLKSLSGSSQCYESMFRDCTSLVTAPNIQITYTSYGTSDAFRRMFQGCTSLEIGPEIALTGYPYDYMYEAMFSGCTKLRYVKAMFTEIGNSQYPFRDWMTGVAESGTFVKNINATWADDAPGIVPAGWTIEKVAP
jgi:hypothetical protein